MEIFHRNFSLPRPEKSRVATNSGTFRTDCRYRRLLAVHWAAFIKFDGLTADSEAGIEAVRFDIGDHAIKTCADAARATERLRVYQVTFTQSIDKASPKLAETAPSGRTFTTGC